MPRISIVTISYNQAPFLERAIRSVIDQQGVDLEYIVVDPGSTDGSRDIIRKYESRIAVTILEPDDGPADGLNRGLAKATGEYFAYLNSDDEYLPGAVREALVQLDGNPGVDVVYGSGWLVDADGKRLKHLLPSRRVSSHLYARGLATIIQQASFVRTAALRRAGGFNTNNHTCWDGEAFFDMARGGSTFLCVRRDWALFRIHESSVTSAGPSARYRSDQLRMFQNFFGRAPGPADMLTQRIMRFVEDVRDPLVSLKKIVRRWG